MDSKWGDKKCMSLISEHPIYSQHTEGSNLIVILCQDKEIQNYSCSDLINGKRRANKVHEEEFFHSLPFNKLNITRNHGNKPKAKIL